MNVADVGENWTLFAPICGGVRPSRKEMGINSGDFLAKTKSLTLDRSIIYSFAEYGDASSCVRDFIFALRVRWEQFSLRPLSSAKFPRNHRRPRLLLLPLSMPLIWLPKDAARKPS